MGDCCAVLAMLICVFVNRTWLFFSLCLSFLNHLVTS